MKIFISDLETALRKIHNKPVDLINPTDKNETDKILNNYLHKRLTIRINSKLTDYNYLGFEREQEAIWIYLESTNCELPKSAEFKNTILYDFCKEQSNIVHLEVNKKSESSRVNYPDSLIKVNF